MTEKEVLNALLARQENYGITDIDPLRGRAYQIVMNGQVHIAVVLVRSFDYYRLKYHLNATKPDLLICHIHDTCVPIPVLHIRNGNFANEYDLPEEIVDIEEQRPSKLGSQVLLGMYLSGVRLAQTLLAELPASTRYRYLTKAAALSKRGRGRPARVSTNS